MEVLDITITLEKKKSIKGNGFRIFFKIDERIDKNIIKDIFTTIRKKCSTLTVLDKNEIYVNGYTDFNIKMIKDILKEKLNIQDENIEELL